MYKLVHAMYTRRMPSVSQLQCCCNWLSSAMSQRCHNLLHSSPYKSEHSYWPYMWYRATCIHRRLSGSLLQCCYNWLSDVIDIGMGIGAGSVVFIAKPIIVVASILIEWIESTVSRFYTLKVRTPFKVQPFYPFRPFTPCCGKRWRHHRRFRDAR